jgi:hypothetical protein
VTVTELTTITSTKPHSIRFDVLLPGNGQSSHHLLLDKAGAADHHRHLDYFAAWVRTWVAIFRQEKTLSKSIT